MNDTQVGRRHDGRDRTRIAAPRQNVENDVGGMDVVAGVDNWRQPTQSLFIFAKHRLNLSALGDVTIGLEHGLITEQLHSAVYVDWWPFLHT